MVLWQEHIVALHELHVLPIVVEATFLDARGHACAIFHMAMSPKRHDLDKTLSGLPVTLSTFTKEPDVGLQEIHKEDYEPIRLGTFSFACRGRLRADHFYS